MLWINIFLDDAFGLLLVPAVPWLPFIKCESYLGQLMAAFHLVLWLACILFLQADRAWGPQYPQYL